MPIYHLPVHKNQNGSVDECSCQALWNREIISNSNFKLHQKIIGFLCPSLLGTTVYTTRLDKLGTSGLKRIYPSWFIPWLASQSQVSLVSLLSVRHGIFEMKLLVLAEAQRPVEMTADVVAKLNLALLAITIHQQMIHFHQITLLVLTEESGHTLHVWCLNNLWVIKEADLLHLLTKLGILFFWWPSDLSPWIPDSSASSTDLEAPGKKIKKYVTFWKLIGFSYIFCLTAGLEINTSNILYIMSVFLNKVVRLEVWEVNLAGREVLSVLCLTFKYIESSVWT